MEKAARRFASWVLSLHVLLLVALVVIVVLASMSLYSSARRQALNQVRVRQELLAAQAARGIADFYRGVQDDLELQRVAETGLPAGSAADAGSRAPVPPGVLSALVWEKLRGRATHLFEIDPASQSLVAVFGDQPKIDPRQLAADLMPRLKGVAKPLISDPAMLDGKLVTLVVQPITGANARLLVAVVPVLNIESRFLNDFNTPENMASLLVDDRMRVVSAKDRRLVGTNMQSENVDPRLRAVGAEAVKSGQRGTREFLKKMTANGVPLEPAMVTLQPVDLPDGRRWWLGVSSTLGDVDAALGQFFRRALIGAGLIILAMTATLVSTATQMIRGRMRLERVQHDVITRELDQAREIQLRWLPAEHDRCVPLDIAAVNRPASHVSGDFYNWFELGDGRTCVVIGDVTGHGLPAAFLMATTQLLVRAIIDRVNDPGRTLREVNQQLCAHVASGQFVTLLVMVIDCGGETVELATAGHPPPLIGSGEAFAPLPVEPQLVMGIDSDVAYRTQRFPAPPGASILLYTDGVTDVQAPDGERLTQAGLERSLFGRYSNARNIVDAALDAIDAFRAGREPSDDLTLVGLQPAPLPVSPPPSLEPAAGTA